LNNTIVERAQLWEIQALTRNRVVAGDFKLGEKYQRTGRVAGGFLWSDWRRPAIIIETLAACPTLPAAYAPDWKITKFISMRIADRERSALRHGQG
jgi:hypothetical protein